MEEDKADAVGETEAGGVFGEPKFKLDDDDDEEEEAETGLVAGDPKSETEEEEEEKVDMEKPAVFVLVLVLCGHGPNGAWESIDVPWGAITMVTVCEMMEFQGNGKGSPPSPPAEDELKGTTDDEEEAVAVVNELVGNSVLETTGTTADVEDDENDEDDAVGGTGASGSGSAEIGGGTMAEDDGPG